MHLLALGLAVFLQAATLPPLTGRVVDNAGLLSPEERASLTSRLEAIENETSVQIVVATIPSLGGDPIEDYSLRLAEAWKAGQKGLDNGVILLVARDDRKVRIEVGYGLEAVIPDGLAGRIIRERIAPSFQQGKYYDGILAAVEGLDLAARKEYPEERERARFVSPVPDLGIGALIFAFLIVGVVGNAIGILVGMLGGAVVLPLFGGSFSQGLGWLSVPMGAFFGLVSVILVRGYSSGGGWTSSGSDGGGGSGSGSGGWSGGSSGSSGGGFSGGGGSFGGGGASGSW
jgi:uncharacterized protein